MPTFEEKRDTFIENLTLLPDTEERFTYLIGLGRKFPPLPDELRKDENLLPGCMSNLWFCPEFRDGLCHYQMDADAALVKGVAALFCSLYSGETPETVINNEPDFLEDCGLTVHLSSRRLTGLGSLRAAIKKFAVEAAAAQTSRV
jgi:cysteine desulfuration protein SufE